MENLGRLVCDIENQMGKIAVANEETVFAWLKGVRVYFRGVAAATCCSKPGIDIAGYFTQLRL